MQKQKQTRNSTHEPLVNYGQLATETGLTVAFLKKAKMDYELPHYKVGKLVRFRVSEVMRWLEARKAI